MRVKPSSAVSVASGEAPDAPSSPAPSDSSMGYTKGSAPTTYPQPAYPNFFDLLDSPGGEDTDSPLPDLEEEFLDMLAESDLAMYPPPPYQAPPYSGAGSYGAAPGYAGNQYVPAPYSGYGGGYGYGPGVTGVTGVSSQGHHGQGQGQQPQGQGQQQQQGINNATNPNNANNSHNLQLVGQKPVGSVASVDNASPDGIYTQGENLLHDLHASVVDRKPVLATLQRTAQQPDPLRAVAKKFGISDGGDSSSVHSSEGEGAGTGGARALGSRSSSSSSKSSTTTTTVAESSKRGTSSKASSRIRTKKEPVVVDVPEEILYEEAQARPIKHRKEPDVVESKDRSVRNAINARVNRQKHKLYVDGLEQEVEDLKKANQDLEGKFQGALGKITEMQKHIKYLENVIANDITISSILTSLKSVENVNLVSSVTGLSSTSSGAESGVLSPRKRKLSGTEAMDLSEPAAKVTSGGVCLHVDNRNVSIEFCEKCAERAANASAVNGQA